ncbi:MAG: ankyrin repeat domain-containing protein [Salibacteraceae bacterium]
MKTIYSIFGMVIMCMISINTMANKQDDFFAACMQCDVDKAKALVAKGADPKALHGGNQTALALSYMCPNVTKYLLEQGVDPMLDGGGALVGAANNYSFEVMKILLDAGMDPNAFSPIYMGTAADQVLKQTNCHPCLQMLKDYGAKLDTVSPEGMNAIHTLALSGMTQEQRKANFKIAKKTMEGFGLKMPDWYGNLGPDRNGTPEDMLKILLSAGCNIDQISGKKNGAMTPLMWAIGPYETPNKPFIAEILINNGADIEIKSGEKKTAMNYASANRSKEIVALLASKGGKSKDKVKETPFAEATKDPSKIKAIMDFPGEGRHSKKGGGYSANVDLLKTKPKKVALVSYYVYDPACGATKSNTVAGQTSASANAWRTDDFSAQVVVDKFYKQSIDDLVAGFSKHGMDLLTPKEFLDTEEKEDLYYGFVQETAKTEKVERTQRGNLGVQATVSTIKVAPQNLGYRNFFVVNERINTSDYANFINTGVGGANRKMTSSLGYELTKGLGVDAVVVCYIVVRRPKINETTLTVDAVNLFMFGPNPMSEGPEDKNRGQFYCGTRFHAKNLVFSSDKTGTDYSNMNNVMISLSDKLGNWVINKEK